MLVLLTQTQLPLNIQERVSANADANANIIAPRGGWSVVVEKSPVGRASLRKMFAFGSIHQEKTWTTLHCAALRCLPSLLRSTLRCIKKTESESELSLRRREEELTQKMEKEFRLPSPSSKPTCKTFKAAESNFEKGRNSSYTNTIGILFFFKSRPNLSVFAPTMFQLPNQVHQKCCLKCRYFAEASPLLAPTLPPRPFRLEFRGLD